MQKNLIRMPVPGSDSDFNGYAVRCVGVIWFDSMFSAFYGLEFTHTKTRVALANLQRNICKNRNEYRVSLDLVMIIGSVCLLIS